MKPDFGANRHISIDFRIVNEFWGVWLARCCGWLHFGSCICLKSSVFVTKLVGILAFDDFCNFRFQVPFPFPTSMLTPASHLLIVVPFLDCSHCATANNKTNQLLDSRTVVEPGLLSGRSDLHSRPTLVYTSWLLL